VLFLVRIAALYIRSDFPIAARYSHVDVGLLLYGGIIRLLTKVEIVSAIPNTAAQINIDERAVP
jgi:hypothetical protein